MWFCLSGFLKLKLLVNIVLRIKNQAYETKICRKDFLEKIKSVLNIDTTFVQYGNIYANADVGGNLKKQLTTKNNQENEAISNCKIE